MSTTGTDGLERHDVSGNTAIAGAEAFEVVTFYSIMNF